MFLELLIFSFIIMLASLSGKLVLWKGFGTFFEDNLTHLVSLSAGVILVIVYGLARESLELAGVPGGLLWMGAGALSMWLLFTFLPTFHHHHSHTDEDAAHSPLDVRRIITSDAIHNIGDGIVLSAALATGGPLGMLTAASIFAHEFVQEVSEFFVLRESGLTTNKALIINFAVSGSILVGAVGSFFLLETFEALEAPLLGISAGAFLLVVLNDLIPHSLRSAEKNKSRITHIVWFVVGLVIMASVSALTPHTHEEHSGHEHARALFETISSSV